MPMKMTFRWYGEKDPVTLPQIAQIPCMTGVVSAVYDVAPGEVWSRESIAAIRDQAAAHGLAFEVVESIPVPEEIKLGAPAAARMIRNWCENLRRLGEVGVKCVCYNFMPVFDWLRSDLSHPQKDGARALAYDDAAVKALDPLTSDLSLPGWDASYTKEQMRGLIAAYKDLGEEGLWENLKTFLKAAVPAAEEAGIRLAIHPDDPPWSLFGLPRIVTGKENIERLFALVPSPANGLTLCTGSLGANPENDLVDMAKTFARQIPFAHLRNVRHTGPRCFEEVGHASACGSLDLYAIVRALEENGFEGYVRPDHGRMIWNEQGRPGYGLFDRALGAAYLNGLFEAVDKEIGK